jgi:hypothetical protein
MIVEVQIACTISKTTGSRDGGLGAKLLAMAPDTDLEGPVVRRITIALAPGTCTPGCLNTRESSAGIGS